MKMFVSHQGYLGVIQHEVLIKELIVHEGVYLALHRPANLIENKYSMWVVSDLLTGYAITKSISKKYAIEKAKKTITKNKDRMKDVYAFNIKRTWSTPNSSVDFALFERIERKAKERKEVLKLRASHNDH